MTLDTSVLYDALIDSSLSEFARRLLSSETAIRAPDLIEVEFASAVTRRVRQGALSRRAAEVAFSRARRIGPELDATGPLLERAFDLSLELAHPVPDCVFLAHAESRRNALVTSDLRFARKVAASPYGRFVVPLPDWTPELR